MVGGVSGTTLGQDLKRESAANTLSGAMVEKRSRSPRARSSTKRCTRAEHCHRRRPAGRDRRSAGRSGPRQTISAGGRRSQRRDCRPAAAPAVAASERRLPIDPESDELDRRVLLSEGVEPLVPAVKCSDRHREAGGVDRTQGPRHGQLEAQVGCCQGLAFLIVMCVVINQFVPAVRRPPQAAARNGA